MHRSPPHAHQRNRRIARSRGEHLAGLGVEVGGLDAALAAVEGQPERIGVVVASLGGVSWALFITRSHVLGSLRLPRQAHAEAFAG